MTLDGAERPGGRGEALVRELRWVHHMIRDDLRSVRRLAAEALDIGAHAAIGGHRLLTRDAQQYRTYFPKVLLLAPPP